MYEVMAESVLVTKHVYKKLLCKEHNYYEYVTPKLFVAKM